MQWRNTNDYYGLAAQFFHWLIVVLIATQFILVLIFHDMPLGLEKIAWIVRHKAVGMTILALACLRLTWRLLNPVPVLPADMKSYERWLAHASHALLYILIFAIPLSGWIMSSLAGIPVSYFGLFDIPVLMAPDKTLVAASKEVHEALSIVLGVTACLHIGAAFYHHGFKQDNVLNRMLPGILLRRNGS
ncbi:MAG TPA: cytochrome b [Gammaproteobacteria bacterium]